MGLNLPTGGSIAMEDVRSLSPGATVAILHGLLISNDEAFRPLQMSEISGLECGRTETGDYIWAHRDEVNARTDVKLCHDYVASSAAIPAASSGVATRAFPGDQASVHSRTPVGAASPKRGKARLCILGAQGLPNVRRVGTQRPFCEWALVDLSGRTVTSGRTGSDDSNPASPDWSKQLFLVPLPSDRATRKDFALRFDIRTRSTMRKYAPCAVLRLILSSLAYTDTADNC